MRLASISAWSWDQPSLSTTSAKVARKPGSTFATLSSPATRGREAILAIGSPGPPGTFRPAKKAVEGLPQARRPRLDLERLAKALGRLGSREPLCNVVGR